MAEYVKAWQCIGCGRLENSATCLGICQDRPVQLVAAGDYEQALADAGQARQRTRQLEAIVRQIATITPRAGEWERSYRVLQARAREALVMD